MLDVKKHIPPKKRTHAPSFPPMNDSELSARCDEYVKQLLGKLERLLTEAYHVCKDIDSTDYYGKWPDSIRQHVADAQSEIFLFNRPELMEAIKKYGESIE